MDAINLILSADNLRTLVLLIAIGWGFTWFKAYIDGSLKDIDGNLKDIKRDFKALDEKMDRKFEAVDEKFKLLKENDFAHLNRTIKALTFTLEKNKFLDSEDKRYVDSYLDEK
ncbi:MAG: hypothetical protein LBU70_05480 [Chitinispirillales bacterium]|jgi:hypothetical protein|nr:hypothetical protein [Chitinispirillales bacterium]